MSGVVDVKITDCKLAERLRTNAAFAMNGDFYGMDGVIVGIFAVGSRDVERHRSLRRRYQAQD